MTRKLAAVIACFSVVLFPWPVAALLALGMSLVEPYVPLVVGLLIDVFYYSSYGGALPLATLSGVCVTMLALLVRSRLVASIIRE